MNILHLQNQLNITCGVSKTIFLLIKNSDKNFKHRVICLGGDGIMRFERIGIFPIVIKYNRFSIYGTIGIFFYILKFCRENKIDIIHSHHRYFDTLSVIVARYLKIKTVMSVQSKVYGRRFVSYKSDLLIACSETIKNHLINYYKVKPNRIKVINNFVDPDEIQINISGKDLKDSLDLGKDSIIIGFLGRFNNKEKGVDLLLKGVNILKKEFKNVQLILVGNGTDKDYIDTFISRNNLRAIIIPSSDNVYNYYNICDIVVVPSRIEPFGIVIIEAGMMKKAVLGSNVDGISEIITNNYNGLIFEKNNYNDLTDKIRKLIEDDNLRKSLGQNLYDDVFKKYSKGISIPLYNKIYYNLLK